MPATRQSHRLVLLGVGDVIRGVRKCLPYTNTPECERSLFWSKANDFTRAEPASGEVNRGM